MIEAVELRLGNIVSDVIGLEKNLIVYKIEKDFITCGDEAFSYPYLIEQLIPIPLTPEILEKCGFVMDDDHYAYRIGGFSLRFYAHDLQCSFGFSYIYDRECQCSDYIRIECHYLHQLQNLYFALTATELKIKEL